MELIGRCFCVVWFVWINLRYVTSELRPIAVRLPLEGDESPPGAVWPLPVSWSKSDSVHTLDPVALSITSNTEGCDVIDGAIARYKQLIVLDGAAVYDPDRYVITQMSISVADGRCDSDYYPHYGMDEHYNLSISDDRPTTLTSNTIWGALRGLETFSQLIYLTEEKYYHINETRIEDWPRFAYRGLMVDTARHFEPMSILLDILDSMAWDKLNAFHWHVVDDQSFPYPSRTFPELQNMGAYSPYHTYSREDVQTILREARLRGIFVIPEFDTPGHTWSWGLSHPELITPCWGDGQAPGVPNYPEHGPREILNPMLETTYDFLDALYQEIVADFPNNLVHLGMDEVYYACWESNPNITWWMNQNNWTTYPEVEQYYSRRLIEIVEAKGSDYIIWQDPVDNDVTVSLSTLVEVWKSTDATWQEYMRDVTGKGYNALLSSPWYLNYIEYGQDWRDFYLVEPHNFTDDPSLWEYVKGGEACLWAEYVDSTNILARLWPRASAVAERLWSPKGEMDVESAKYRLDQHRCRYVRRGIPAQPILNGYCGDYEWRGEVPIEPEPSTTPPNTGSRTTNISWFLHIITSIVFLKIALS